MNFSKIAFLILIAVIIVLFKVPTVNAVTVDTGESNSVIDLPLPSAGLLVHSSSYAETKSCSANVSEGDGMPDPLDKSDAAIAAHAALAGH